MPSSARPHLALAALPALLALVGYAHAEDTPAPTTVVVTASPLGTDYAAPASVLSGRDLDIRRSNTLGETLNTLPGVSTTGYGPWVARPIIRGMDGDRIRLLQNGIGMVDASSLSYDHAVPQDPLTVNRIEVVRGPAALRYGGNAVGGVVNTFDNRIPETPLSGPTGAAALSWDSANNMRDGSALFETGNDRLALHVDAFSRQSDELKIPGYARSPQQRALDAPGTEQTQGHLPNSDGRADGGSVGGSVFWDHGYVGASATSFDSNYGSVAEDSVRLRMHQDRYALKGQLNDLSGPLQSVDFSAAYTRYQHKEIDDGTVGTTFKNKGYEGRVEAHHADLGPVQGIVGFQFADTQFSALGDEALVPQTTTRNEALFALEEWQATQALKLSLGGRVQHDALTPDAAGNDRFDTASARSFNTGSAALGAVYTFLPQWAVLANVSYTERAPTFYELYANGPHDATGQYLIGDQNLGKEKSRSIDLALRYQQQKDSARVGAFYTRFSNYLAELNTGNFRSDDGELVEAGTDDALPEAQYQAVPARFYGFEYEGKAQLAHFAWGDLLADLSGDYTRANNTRTGEALPRISPFRLNAGLSLAIQNGWLARAGIAHAGDQNQVPQNDLPTDGYTTLGLQVSRSFTLDATQWLAYVRADNLTNQDVRYASSVLRNVAPEAGRSFKLGLKASF